MESPIDECNVSKINVGKIFLVELGALYKQYSPLTTSCTEENNSTYVKLKSYHNF